MDYHFSKIKGDLSVKEREINQKIDLINETQNSELFKFIIEKFPDANLTDVKQKKKKGLLNE